MIFTSDFEAAFITLKYPRINVSITFTDTNVLLQNAGHRKPVKNSGDALSIR